MTAVRLVLLGRQGAGKGTQAVRLADHYGAPHISTGDMFRAAVAEETELGVRAKEIMDRGDLVPDEITIGIVRERLAKDDARSSGFLLDGFPRTVAQAESLEDLAAPLGGLHAVVNIDVPLDEVRERMRQRGRADDTDEAIDRRLELYERETQPLISFYEDKGLMVTVDGLGTMDEVFARLVAAIDEVKGRS
ncbi:adenylate kinase [Actinomarinicola tropica]|uniref:Adenylate kinase n=1 Tax=Actinomarinicola tropica TaxID=2789776 RepID=A0A5Q2RE36_9ACTN|nr:adenylate kinase [Actinomarinicola tropica]QGG93883.1 adenylate kinase [Actinomarinicola tropica]